EDRPARSATGRSPLGPRSGAGERISQPQWMGARVRPVVAIVPRGPASQLVAAAQDRAGEWNRLRAELVESRREVDRRVAGEQVRERAPVDADEAAGCGEAAHGIDGARREPGQVRAGQARPL